MGDYEVVVGCGIGLWFRGMAVQCMGWMSLVGSGLGEVRLGEGKGKGRCKQSPLVRSRVNTSDFSFFSLGNINESFLLLFFYCLWSVFQ